MPKKPHLPKLSVSNIEKLRDRLYDHAFVEFLGKPMSEEAFADLVAHVTARLPSGCPLPVVQQSMLTLLGPPLGEQDAYATAWRLAGNVPLLRGMQPVGPWTRQEKPEWVPVQVMDVLKGRDRYKKPGAHVHLRVLAGTPAGLLLIRWWSQQFCSFLAPGVGFRRRRVRGKLFYYSDMTEFTSMRFFNQLDPSKTSGGKLAFGLYDTNSSILKWNRTILTARLRVDPPCPIKSLQPCKLCPVGTDRCLAGCHAVTYEQRQCVQCKKLKYCDPDASHGLCVGCATQL